MAESPAEPKNSSDGARWAAILEKHCWRRHVTVKLFHPTGSKLVKRHGLNQRRLDQTVSKYKEGLLEHGFLEECRGTLVLIPSRDQDDTPMEEREYDVIGGGTIFEAMYAAIEDEPENQYAVKLKKEGVRNTLVLNRSTPED